jgi:hypothetical protein
MRVTTDVLERADFDAQYLLDSPDHRENPKLVKTVSGSLAAIGYPFDWQAEQTGITNLPIGDPTLKRFRVTVDDVRAILVLAATIGDQPATPENTGCTQEEIADAIAWTERRPHFPPIRYDEHWDLIYNGSRRGYSAGQATTPDRDAVTRLTGMRMMIWRKLSASDAARLLGCSTENLQRAMRAVGLKMVTTSNPNRYFRGPKRSVVEPLPGQHDLIMAITRADLEVQCGGDPLEVWDALVDIWGTKDCGDPEDVAEVCAVIGAEGDRQADTRAA